MRQHKAPTSVTIASTTEKSDFSLWVEKYWKLGVGITIVVIGWIVYRAEATTVEHVKGEEGWSKLLAVTSQDQSTGMLTGSVDDLHRVAAEVEQTPAGPWALYLSATNAFANKEFEKATGVLSELKTKFPQHQLITLPLVDEKGSAASAVAVLEARIEAQRAFVREHPGLFDNPPLPADAPKVRLTTDHGVIVVGLYSNLAPKVVENFLKLARDGSYVGTKFHMVANGQYVRGGDPNSVKGERDTWGKGGPGYSLDKETSGLAHFTGMISAAPDAQDPTKISGSQFIITSAEVHSLDVSCAPFGRVLEGLDVLREIERLPLQEKSFSQPKDPASLISAEVQ
jgi:cyclophilin family peptidyl-prolyl cis-trans isomerase